MADTYQDISEQQLFVIMIVYIKVLDPILQVFGLFSNVLNLTMFTKLGIGDSMNLSFWALSLSDFSFVLCCAVNNVCMVVALSPWQQDIPVSMLSLVGWLSWYQYIFLDTSTCIETYIAVARCCCVALPLRFKNVFTVARTTLVIVSSLLASSVFRIPVLYTHGLSWQASPLTNTTRFTIWYAEDFMFFKNLEKIAGRTVFPIIFLVIATICLIILASSLVKASRNRTLMTGQKMETVDFKTNPFYKPAGKGKSDNSFKVKLSTKELQVVKAVTMVTFFLGFCLLIFSVSSLAEIAVPEFFPGRKYNRLHGCVSATTNFILTAHASGKVLIYYNFNSRFRDMVRQAFTL